MMNAYPRWSILAVPLLTALVSAACSDPVPPPAQGAVTLYLGQPVNNTGSGACPAPGITYQVAAVDSKTKAIAAPSASDPGESLISGEQGSKISCSVKKSGGNFAFSGSIYGTTQQGQTINITMDSGTVDGTTLTGTTNVSVYTPELSASYTSNMPCTVTVINNQIKGGSMWATFACDQLSSPPSGLCGVSSASAIVFENCDGS